MTGTQMRKIRTDLGLSTIALGRALGYEGNDNTVSVLIRKYEGGSRDMPPWLPRLMTMFQRYGVPPEFLGIDD